jgi:predicted nucleic acid-binding protein
VIVVDASAVIEVLLHSPLGQRIEARLFDHPVALHAPELLDVEVAQVLRRFNARGDITSARGATSLRLLDALPIRRHPHAPLLPRLWALRANLTAYDAAYVALAEALGAALVTCDGRLAGAPGMRAPIEVIAARP